MNPSLSFYHANCKGTGSAAKFCCVPATETETGGIIVKLASQKTTGCRTDDKIVSATFDWDSAIEVKLDFTDLAQMLQVFRGETESIGEGKGLYKKLDDSSVVVRLTHIVEPTYGYRFEVVGKANDVDCSEKTIRLLFSYAEALGLCEAICGSMHMIAFGV